MANQDELLGTIQKAVRDVLNNQNLSVMMESKLIGDLGLESIDLLDLSSELEQSIGKELDFKEVAEFVKKRSGGSADMKTASVKDLTDYIMANP